MTQNSTQVVSSCKPYDRKNGMYYEKPKVCSGRKRVEILKSNLAKVIPALYAREKSHMQKVPKVIWHRFLKLEDWQGIFMFGSVGCGKTFIMSAFARYFVLRQRKVIFTACQDLCLEIRNCFNTCESELALIKKYREIDKLFIDDLGTAVSIGSQESDFTVRLLYDIFDWRVKNLKATFFTSNKCPEEIGSSFDERIESRFYQACEIIPVSGSDKRRVKC